MGNPSSGSKAQTTMSLPKGRHRQSLSVGASLEKLAQHEKLSSAEKLASGAVSPRTTEEMSIAAFLGDKKMKRRTRSSLGGSEEFSKGFELHGAAMAAEDRKPLSSIAFRGHRRGGSGNVTPKAAESPRAKVMCTPQGVEKNAVAKIASSLFHSPTKLERSMSLSRVAHRVIPDADGSTPRCRTGVGEVILPGKRRDALTELKRQDFQRGVESKLKAHRSENGSGRRSCSVILDRKREGPGAPKPGKASAPYAHDNDENFHHETTANHFHGASVVVSAESWPSHEQMFWNPAYLPVKDIHPVCFETAPKLRTEQPMTSRSLDMGHDLHGFLRRSSCSTRGFNPSGPEAASELGNAACIAPGLKPAERQSANLSSTHVENSYRINYREVLSNSSSAAVGLETICSIEFQGQPFLDTTPSRKRSSLELSRQDFKNFHCHPLPLPPPSKTPQVKDVAGTHGMKQKQPVSCSSDKVTEEVLTEAAFLSSLMSENYPAVPVLVSEEPNALHVEGIVISREEEVGLRNSSDPGACLRKSTSFEPGLEEKARIEHEKRSKLRKRRRSVSASGIGAMLLKVVRVSDSGPLETRMVPIAEPEVSRIDSVQSRDCCAQRTVPSLGQSQPLTTSLNEDAEAEAKTHNTEAVDMDVEYQNCDAEIWAPDVDACHKVNVEDASENKDKTRLPEEELQVVGDAREGKLKNYAGGSQPDSEVHGSQEEDQTADSELDTTSWNSNGEQDKREISGTAANDPNEVLEERIFDAGVEGLDCNARHRETSSTSGHGSEGAYQEEKIDHQEVVTENSSLKASRVKKEEGPGGSRRNKPGSKGRVSYDLDYSDCRLQLQTGEISEAKTETETEHVQTTSTIDHSNKEQPPALLDENVAITREARPRSFASMLQVSPRQSADDYHLAPSSISILANPSFSSSHQDRLWEEQAEAYSSGGRGTPGREDDAAAGNVCLHSPSPGGAISSDDQINSCAGSLRKGQGDTSVRSASGFLSDTGRSDEKKKRRQGKKRGRPRTPLRSLLAQDLHSKTTTSPESHGRFLQQLMSRIRGSSSSKSSSPKSQEAAMPKRRNTIWSSCLCFPH